MRAHAFAQPLGTRLDNRSNVTYPFNPRASSYRRRHIGSGGMGLCRVPFTTGP